MREPVQPGRPPGRQVIGAGGPHGGPGSPRCRAGGGGAATPRALPARPGHAPGDTPRYRPPVPPRAPPRLGQSAETAPRQRATNPCCRGTDSTASPCCGGHDGGTVCQPQGLSPAVTAERRGSSRSGESPVPTGTRTAPLPGAAPAPGLPEWLPTLRVAPTTPRMAPRMPRVAPGPPEWFPDLQRGSRTPRVAPGPPEWLPDPQSGSQTLRVASRTPRVAPGCPEWLPGTPEWLQGQEQQVVKQHT